MKDILSTKNMEHNIKMIIKSDLERYLDKNAKINMKTFLISYLLFEGFHYTVIFRLANYYAKIPFINFLLKLNLRRLSHKFGIIIPVGTRVGCGLTIAHFGGIVINRNAVLGCNVSLRPNVVIGEGNNGLSPVVGDNVTIGTGAIIIGGIRIGNNATIGAGAVCVKDVGDGEIVVGNPARIIVSEKRKPLEKQ